MKNSKILKFSGIDGLDVYNPSVPFPTKDGIKLIAGRVERRSVFWKDDDYTPETRIFMEEGEFWRTTKEFPVFYMEDPFVTFINGEMIFGGVEVFKKNNEDKFKTVFYKGKDIFTLEKIAYGPDMMKDIRLVELEDGKIGVFTRPQRGIHKRGRIGFIILDKIEELNNHKKMLEAEIIRNDLLDNQWEGVNEALAIDLNYIGVLAHFATIDKLSNKDYCATTFLFEYKKKRVVDFKVIATRQDFPKAEAKSSELENIVFPSGLVEQEDSLYDLYAGVGDSFSMVKEKIENPFYY